MRTIVFGAIALVATSTFGFGQCPASGLQLGYQGTRLGDPFTLTLNGTPGVPGLLGIDAAGGPVQTPIGTLCLGLTPAMQLVPFALDTAGQFTLTGILPLQAGLHGASVFLQGAAVDPTQPTGTALSNSTGVTFRSPRVYVIGHLNSAFAWCSYDPLTNASVLGPIFFPPPYIYFRDAVLLPSLGWIAFVLGSSGQGSAMCCYDVNTGALTLSVPIPGEPGRVALDGTTLRILCYPAGSTPPRIISVSLPSGTLLPFIGLAAGDSPWEILIPPSGGYAYLRCESSIRIVHLASGTELPPITVGGYAIGTSGQVKEWLLVGNTLYTVADGNGFPGIFGSPALLDAIDTTTHQALHPAPVPLPFFGTVGLLRYGPGQFGNCLFLRDPNNFTSAIMQINPATLTIINQVLATPPGLTEMALSPGGTEWLLLCNFLNPGTAGIPGCGVPTVLSMQVPSMTVSSVTAFNTTPWPAYTMYRLGSIRSATLRLAFVINDGHIVYPFSTDPATPVMPAFVLPLGPGIANLVLIE